MNKGIMYTNVNTEKSPLMAYLPLRLPGRTDWRESRSAVPKTRFSFFMFQRRIIQILPMNRGGKSRRMGCHQSPLPYPTLDLPTPPVGVFLSRCPDASVQVVPNAMTTSSQLRSGFGWVSVEFRSTIGIHSIKKPHLEILGRQGVRGYLMAYSPTEHWIAPARIWFCFGWFRKSLYLCTLKKNRVSTTATT